MSWEIMRSEAGPCECGTGAVTYVFEMDDWNRTRSSTEVQCPACRRKADEEAKAEWNLEQRRSILLQAARELGTKRYLSQWQALFSGISKRAAWERYTGGSGYPALGTFYQHARDFGSLSKYMDWCFPQDLEKSLIILHVQDREITAMLKEHSRLWKPTNKSL